MDKLTDSYYTTRERKERIDRLANSRERSRSWIINKCLEIALPLLESNGNHRRPARESPQ